MSNKKSKPADNDYPLAKVIRGSAHQIWLAGLGAMGRAETEGNSWFESLIALGEQIERSARMQIQRPIDAVEKTVTDVRETANDTWTRLELALERRIAKILNSMQIPTSRDIDALTRRVEALQRLVAELSTEPKTPDTRPRRKASGRSKTTSTTGKKKAIRRKTPAKASRASSGRKTARRSASRKTRASA